MTDDMDDLLPPMLKLLKWLVIGLTATMIVGLIVLITLFVTRFPSAAPTLPDYVVLPDGENAVAVTRGRDWIAVVTEGDEILILAPDGRTLRQRVTIETDE